MGAINTVVKMLTHQNEEVRKSAAGAVAALAENDFSNQIAIRKCGAVPALIKNISEDNADDTKEQGDFREGPGIPTLVNLMSSSHIGVKIHSTGAIMELSRDNPKNCDVICNAGGVHPLVAALDSENKVVQYLSEGAIWALARKSTKRRKMFRDANALDPLRILRTSDNPQVKKGAEWAIEVLS